MLVGNFGSKPETLLDPARRLGTTADESLRKAGAEGMPILFGTEPVTQLAERLERYRAIRSEAGASSAAIDHEIGQMYVLRRICVADSDEAAWREVQEPLRWQRELGRLVHECGEPAVTLPALADGPKVESTAGECFGSIATVRRRLEELRALGLRKVIGWFHFGNLPHESVRRSMQLMTDGVMAKT